MYIFLDANILFSGAFSDGAIRRLIHDIRDASHTMVADRYVIEEARRNIAIHRVEALEFLHNYTAALTIVPTRYSLPAGTMPRGIRIPEKVIPVLATAIDARCTILMTGDERYFGPLFGKTVAGVTICPPVEVARMLIR